MKTTMKKIFSLMLVAVLLVGAMPFQAFATENAECALCNGAADHCAVCNECLMGLDGGCPNACSVAADEPAANEPAANEPAANEPAADEPAADEPAADEPAADEPAADEPAAPAAEVPAPVEYNVLVNLNYPGATSYSKNVAKDTNLSSFVYKDESDNVIFSLAVTPVRAGYAFEYWQLSTGGALTADTKVTSDVVVTAIWSEASAISPAIPEDPAVNTNTGITVTFDPNYNSEKAVAVSGVAYGTNVYGIHTFTRKGYTFGGWYLDKNLSTMVSTSSIVTGPATYYAKWIQDVPHEVYVKFYTNGNTSSVTKYVDLYNYAQDGVITLDELRVVAKDNIKANNKAGLSVYGPFNASQWEKYCLDDYYRNPEEKIYVNSSEKTVIYAMVHNAVINGSSSTSNNKTNKADSSNPKTGDMILMPAAVLGLSASTLAVMFYLDSKKKRSY